MTHRRRLVSAVTVAAVLATGGLSDAESSTNLDAGREVFTANCAMCHGQDASGMMGMHPSLRGSVDRLTVEGVEVAIRNGRDTNPPVPAFGDRLAASEIDDVIGYLDSLPEGPRNFGPGDGEGMMGGDTMSGRAPALFLGVLVGTLLTLVGVAAFSAARRTLGAPSRDDYLQRRRDIG